MNTAFRWLWLGAGSANLADGILLTALPLIALAAGASPAEVGLVVTAATIAWPLFGLHAGWIVDRVAAPRLLAIVSAARVLAFGALAVAVVAQVGIVPLVIAVAVLYGLAETLVDTALIAAVPRVVARDRLTGANARLEATVNIANQLAGPPLAGVLVAVSSAVAVVAGGALYAVAGIAALLLARSRPAAAWRATSGETSDSETSDTTPRVRDGIAFLWRHPLQRPLTLLTAAMSLVWGAWASVFVLYAVAPGPLGLDTAAYGWMLAAMAAGGIAASAVTARLERRLGTVALLVLDLVGTIALVLPAALGAGAWLVLAGLVVAGAGSSVWRILVAVIRQRTTPAALIGRVYAASRVVSWGALPLGSAFAAFGASTLGVDAVLGISSAVAIGVAVWFAAIWGRMSRLVRAAEHTAAPAPAATQPMSVATSPTRAENPSRSGSS
ncbi:MFS transporter [Agromyces intestinalis]|uniref:MFS transporter n=1 Tax=Agromyces intestinalis TaxID=2592652 RepID=A0A5C1YCL6_9MICO|nr:MFS transporter [Agromyces intestinalis]QEO13781.1 MFS transporter [Agromyces intestinalis]